MAGRLERTLQHEVAAFSVAELLPALLLAAFSLAEVPGAEEERVHGPRSVLLLVSLAAACLLALRTRRPLTVLLAIAGLLVVPPLVWGASQLSAGVFCVVIAVFSCGRYARRPWAYVAPLVMAAAALVQAWKDPLESVESSWTWSLNGLWIFGLGAWLRQKSVLDEKARAEVEALALARAAQDRVQIARDLHDVLAHNLAVMVLQAEAADALLDVDPAKARQAIGTVQGTGRDALRDVRGLLGALRGDPGPARAPGLEGVAPLVELLRGSGHPVTLDVSGDVARVPAAQAEVAYRAVQEALTNTVRHAGSVPTRVTLRVDDSVLVEVRDDGDVVGVPVAGHGLSGMRERVQALGGVVAAGPAVEGGFVVRVQLPLGANT